MTQSSASHLLTNPSTSTASEDKIKQEIRRLETNKRTNTGKLRNEAKNNTLQCVLNKLLDKYDNSDSDNSD